MSCGNGKGVKGGVSGAGKELSLEMKCIFRLCSVLRNLKGNDLREMWPSKANMW
jgi:hypothetical protein